MSESEGGNIYTAGASYINTEGEEDFVRLTNEHQLACNASLMEIVLYYIIYPYQAVSDFSNFVGKVFKNVNEYFVPKKSE
jgi:hypothetical protein|tara:strand:+ start:99 stop:338 length:240 start_codon:yes stop_codon:yes gene_type:complete